jgi:hypothetical protein
MGHVGNSNADERLLSATGTCEGEAEDEAGVRRGRQTSEVGRLEHTVGSDDCVDTTPKIW